MVGQKSAEGIVGILGHAEGPNMIYRTGALNFDVERDAAK